MSIFLTEDEAHEKWCPHARVTTYDKNIFDFAEGVTVGMCAANKQSDGTIRTGARCIASDCMSWRWATPGPGRGFCGLSGRPVVPNSEHPYD